MGYSYPSDRYLVCGKRPLGITAMNAELPPFKTEEYNSESVSTIDRVTTPLNKMMHTNINNTLPPRT